MTQENVEQSWIKRHCIIAIGGGASLIVFIFTGIACGKKWIFNGNKSLIFTTEDLEILKEIPSELKKEILYCIKKQDTLYNSYA